jgi:hypothetical protein
MFVSSRVNLHEVCRVSAGTYENPGKEISTLYQAFCTNSP